MQLYNLPSGCYRCRGSFLRTVRLSAYSPQCRSYIQWLPSLRDTSMCMPLDVNTVWSNTLPKSWSQFTRETSHGRTESLMEVPWALCDLPRIFGSLWYNGLIARYNYPSNPVIQSSLTLLIVLTDVPV